jgi:hypothetical protein
MRLPFALDANAMSSATQQNKLRSEKLTRKTANFALRVWLCSDITYKSINSFKEDKDIVRPLSMSSPEPFRLRADFPWSRD